MYDRILGKNGSGQMIEALNRSTASKGLRDVVGEPQSIDVNYGTISESYANLAPGNPDGGVAAYNYGTIAPNVFWNAAAAGSALANGVSSPALGLSGAQLGDPSSFGPTWDFSTNGVWAMPAGATAPVLRWQLTQQ